MPIGPGKYDAACTDVREKTKAAGVLLIVLGGEHGNGFACQTAPEALLYLPELLEAVAEQIRRDGPFGTPRS